MKQQVKRFQASWITFLRSLRVSVLLIRLVAYTPWSTSIPRS